MDIIQALKSDGRYVRVTLLSSWLFWNEINGTWVVVRSRGNGRRPETIIETPYQDAAVAALLGETE